MHSQIKLAATAALLVIAASFASCSKNDDNNSNPGGGGSTPPPPAKVADTTVKVAQNGTFGAILTDSTGNSLYFFANDANGQNNCTGGCVAKWPIFYVDSAKLTISAGLKASDFGTITTPNGKQTTYKGWPLYYYASDAKAGDTGGDNVGTIWFIAKPDYTVMWANQQLVGNDGKDYTFTSNTIAAGTGASKYVVSDYGKTLYKFAPDTKGKNTYTTTDATKNAAWPIYMVTTVANVPTGLDKADFGVITVAAVNQSQITYKGWPMYYFGSDAKRGDTKGVSVPSINIWPVFNTSTVAAQ